MKPKAVLLASLLFNAALLAKIFLFPSPTTIVTAKSSEPVPTRSVTSITSAPAILPVKSGGTNFDWRTVESSDYRQYMANLRAIGCPELTIQEIIIADVDKLYAGREKALRQTFAPSQSYYEAKNGKLLLDDTNQRIKALALKKEKHAVIYELLHVQLPLYGENEKQLYGSDPQRALSSVPEDKRLDVAFITQKYDMLTEAENVRGIYNADDNRRINDVRKARLAELEAVLGVPAARAYYAQTSWMNRDLRTQLTGFNASEAEFRIIHDLRERLDFNYGNPSHYEYNDAEGRNKFAQGAAQMETEMRQALGPQRYADYQRTMDGGYQQLVQLANTLLLPNGPEVVNQVYATKANYEQQSRELSSKPMDAQAKSEAIAQLRAETEASVRSTMGETAFQRYKGQGGSWLNNNPAANRNRFQF